jgi:hypothetical protein
MSRIGALALTLSFTAVTGLAAQTPAAHPAPRATHVVIISVDGFRPDFYLDERWPAPTIQQMAREGAHARGVRSVFPSVTYPSHTTIVTGALPARHGIVYNMPFEGLNPTGRWYWDASAIKLPTLWDAVRAAGGKSAAVSWPVTVGAAIDWNIPEVFSVERLADPLQPMREASRPRGLFEEVEREATGHLTAELYGGNWLARDDRSGAMAAYLLERYRPTLLLLHVFGTDHWQHEEGRDGPHVRRAVAAVDRAVGQVLDAAERAGIRDSTAIIVTGDHGFVDVDLQVRPNVWLVRAGLAPAGDGPWRALFHPSGAAAFLHLRDPADRDAVARARAALDALPPGERRLFRVLDRAALDAAGADPAAALALAPVPGVSFSPARDGNAVSPGTGGTHGYFPDFDDIRTGFVGWGAGFRPGAVASTMGLEDVAPIVAELLGLRFQAPDGVLHPGLLSAAPR